MDGNSDDHETITSNNSTDDSDSPSAKSNENDEMDGPQEVSQTIITISSSSSAPSLPSNNTDDPDPSPDDTASQRTNATGDDEDDAETIATVKKSKVRRLQTLLDSDSDDEEFMEASKPERSDSDDGSESVSTQKTPKSSYSRLKIDSDPDSDEETERNQENDKNKRNISASASPEARKKSAKISDLIDSDSDDEPRKLSPEEPEESEKPKNAGSKKTERKKSMSKRAAKDEALSKIHSETQRLIRESSVFLPYHRPKQRTLEEFLSRKKVAAELPAARSMAAKLKISATIASRVLEEKEREAEIFYKSSDSEDEMESQQSENLQNHQILLETADQKSTEESQKSQESQESGRADIQKEQQVCQEVLESGVARKLFVDDLEEDHTPSEPSEGFVNHKSSESSSQCVNEVLKTLEPEENLSELEKNLSESEKNPLELEKNSLELEKNSSESEKKSSETSQNSADSKVENSTADSSNPANFQAEISAVPETSISGSDESAKISAEISPSPLEETNIPDEDAKSDVEELDGHVLGLPLSDSEPEDDKTEPPSSAINVPPLVAKKNAILNMSNVKPKLRGNPGMIIDFTESPKLYKQAINSLMDRFLTKHAPHHKQEDRSTEVSILQTEITPNGVKISTDTLLYKPKDGEDSELHKPGAKLSRLKEELMRKMVSKRNEEWKQKEEGQVDEEEDEEEVEEVDKDEVSDEAESEPEEDDVVVKEKRRKSCAFGDEEAEVSEEENVELSEDENEGEEENEENEEEEDEENEEEEDEDHGEDEEVEENSLNKSKKFSRIIQMDEESDSGDENINSAEPEHPKKAFERTNTDVDIFADDDDGVLNDLSRNKPASQRDQTPPPSSDAQLGASPLLNTSQLDPISQANTTPKNPPGNTQSPFSPFTFTTPTSQTPQNLDKSWNKLFEEEVNPVTEEDLLELCSGRFPGDSTQATQPDLRGLVSTSSSEGVTESQLMNLCSGSFPTQSQAKKTDSTRNDDNSQDFRLTMDPEEPNKTPRKIEPKSWNLEIASSDEEEKENSPSKSKKKKKVKKLVLSDDEEDDELSEESEVEPESEEEKFVDYDSEENEVVVIPKKDITKVAANYLEEEAELSESEWGSEDEDEKGLDKYELEEADGEEIDEDLMRSQIGKIHARQLLDEDNRDVRMLKELLFEDGDLHDDSGGRERKFRWKNIDKIGLENLLGPTADEDAAEEEQYDAASELEWRKLRLERQKYLQEKSKETSEVDGDIEADQFLSLGMKALKKNNTQPERDPVLQKKKPLVPRSVSELVQFSSTSRVLHGSVKRGSFLARGEQALAKLAVMIKQTDTVPLAPKNAGNFVFTHVSPSVNESTETANEEVAEKRLNGDALRKRKSASGATPKTSKRAKMEVDRGKKLF